MSLLLCCIFNNFSYLLLISRDICMSSLAEANRIRFLWMCASFFPLGFLFTNSFTLFFLSRSLSFYSPRTILRTLDSLSHCGIYFYQLYFLSVFRYLSVTLFSLFLSFYNECYSVGIITSCLEQCFIFSVDFMLIRFVTDTPMLFPVKLSIVTHVRVPNFARIRNEPFNLHRFW